MSATRLDPESAEWVQALTGNGPRRDAAVTRLHELFVRIARGEVRRRGPRLQITGPELEDLAYQAAADALLAVTSKLRQFQGESRFTTWACKFVIFEVSNQDRTALLAEPERADARRELGSAAGPVRL
jgi:RNA polymerase sigma-70 factor, ECF subfamily